MNFKEYQKKAQKFDTSSYEDFLREGKKLNDFRILEKILGLMGETGEVCEKLKKIIRDDGGDMSESKKQEIMKEMGDVLWYMAMVAKYLQIDFEDIAKKNIEKLQDRLDRNKIHGSGDER